MRRGEAIGGGVAALFAAGLAGAAEFDGLYRAAPTVDCNIVGVEGGALKIEGDTFVGVEVTCRMTRPVNVRDMGAQLFDMACEAGERAFTERAMLMHAADGGLIMAWDGYAFKYDRCLEDPVEGTVTTPRDLGIVDPPG